MKHYGDICKINVSEVEPVNVVVGGSPCQDLSVAGLRKGLSGERSGLFLEQIRIIKEMRERSNGADNIGRYLVWENVPGALSSNESEDFRIVLEEICKVADQTVSIPRPPKGKWTHSGTILGDGYSVAWRIHDSRFWGKSVVDNSGKVVKRGTPQRRRRIAVVADYGGHTAPMVLFEEASVESEGMLGCVKANLEETVRGSEDTYRDSEKAIEGEPICVEMTSTKNTVIEDGICPTLTSRMGTGGNQVNVLLDNVCIGIDRAAFNQGENALYNPQFDVEFTQSLVSRRPNAVMCKSVGIHGDVAGTLDASYYKGCGERNGVERDILVTEENSEYVVRRLSPVECERLMGFEDNWTDIGDWTDSSGRIHKGDSWSNRYKALGNSICLPYWEWMSKRMREFLPKDKEPTMCSLFDGIGGFCVVFQRAGFKPVWSSEIDEYCLAVERKHFPE